MSKDVLSAARAAGNHNGCDRFGQAHSAATKVIEGGSFDDWHLNFAPIIRLHNDEWATRAQRVFPLVVA